MSCRKWSGRGGNKGPKGPARVVGDPVPLRLHDDLALPHGAQQVRAEVRSERNEGVCVLGVEPRHQVSREDTDWRRSAGSDVAGWILTFVNCNYFGNESI